MGALDIILSKNNLRKHNIMIIDWCCMCKRSTELVEHLLLHCMVSRDIWSFVFAVYGASRVMLKTLV